MTVIPPHFMRRPLHGADAQAAAAFDALYDATVRDGADEPINYTLPWPRWQFIAHVSDTRGVVVHGSQNGAIALFEPRKSNDVHPFGDRAAVFGSSDGLWSMYYAILDRASHPMMLLNAAFRVEGDDGSLGEPLYYFSISDNALAKRPFAPDMIYFLPGDGFETMPPMLAGSTRIHIAQHASLSPVRPLARIAVQPEDFPFLEQMRGHDDEAVLRRIKDDPDGFPWLNPSEPG